MAKARVETVKTGRFSMDYCRFGRGSRILVILPGLSVRSVMPAADAIAEAYRPLTDEFTVYVFDRRKDLPDPYSVKDMARDTAEAIRALDLGTVDVFGASLGGMVAMEIAIERPGLVRRLVLGSTAARISDARSGLFEEWIRLAKAGETEKLYLAFGEVLYPKEVFENVRARWIAAAADVTEAELARFVTMIEGMRGFDLTDKLWKIQCPALVIGSKDDRVIGADAPGQIAGGLKDGRLYLYDGYGHAAYDVAPDYQERMRDFLLAEESAPR